MKKSFQHNTSEHFTYTRTGLELKVFFKQEIMKAIQ